MKVHMTIPKLFVLTLLLTIGAVLPYRAIAHGGGGTPGSADTLTAKTVPVPPVNPDSGNSGFSKLVVKNLGPVVNSKSDDFAPTVTADGRTMFFASDRNAPAGHHHFWE